MIYVECNPDEVLVKSFGIPHKKIEHAHSKGRVCKRLERNKNSKGLVDEDPLCTQPKYIEKLKPFSQDHDIKLLFDERSQNYLIMLCPSLEEWILKAAKEEKVDVKAYNLPDRAERLHEIINLKQDNFKKLMKDIRKESKMLKALDKALKG